MTEDVPDKIEAASCCDTPQIEESRGFRVCVHCGLVHGPSEESESGRLKTNVEGRIISSNNSYTPYQIYPMDTTYTLEGLSPTQKAHFNRLKRLNNSHTSSKYRANAIAYKTLCSLSELMNIPKFIQQEVMVLYSQILQERLTKGRRIKELITAITFLMCKVYGIDRSLKEFVQQTQSPLPLLRGYIHLLQKTFNLKSKRLPLEHYIETYCTQFNLSSTLRVAAFKLAKKVRENELGPNRSSIAAAILYIVDQTTSERTCLRQKKLADIASTSEVTIRKYAHIIQEFIEVPESLMKKRLSESSL
jgi:transcription initiation factor TFIIIB Brf1 subunit/transcription initiation factor TFIIB